MQFIKYCVVGLICTLSCLSTKGLSANIFADDLGFIQQYDTPIVLKSADEQQQIVLSAKHQGRVLTSTANGLNGLSNGWLNKSALQSNKGNVGGEDRTWLAPIGSKHSLFYAPNTAISSKNWRVPPALQKQNYHVITANEHTAQFQQELALENYQGTKFKVRLERTVSILSKQKVRHTLKLNLPKTIKVVAYQSHNKLTNLAGNWQSDNGLITIWSMAMLQGTDDSISMFTIKPEQANAESYLYPLGQDRLTSNQHLVFYKTDGKYRSKIGLPANISGDLMLSYSASLKRLTVIKFSIDNKKSYPIALEQEETGSIKGDVTNAYNHGDISGSVLKQSAFYELESSAPMLPLKTNEFIEHTQQVIHFIGEPENLDKISEQLIDIKVSQTQHIFKTKQ